MTQADWDAVLDRLRLPLLDEERISPGVVKAFNEARLVYADWLEEDGQAEQARFQLWLVANRKCPIGDLTRTTYVWDRGRSRKLQEYCYVLGPAVFKALPPVPRPLYQERLPKSTYSSRRQAENALLVALKATGLLNAV